MDLTAYCVIAVARLGFYPLIKTDAITKGLKIATFKNEENLVKSECFRRRGNDRKSENGEKAMEMSEKPLVF